MTVSRQRATDGNSQRAVEYPGPGEGRGPLQMNDPMEREALPPTLFQLPNLNAATPKSPATAAHGANSTAEPREKQAASCQTDDAPTEVAPRTSNGIPPFPGPRDSSLAPCVSKPVSPANAACVPKASSSDSVAQSPDLESNRMPLAAKTEPFAAGNPAGRAWMETVGSHGIVVLLLLVVVAAALVTGRNTQDHDTTLSEQTELLDFGAAADVELPLPEHGFDDPTEFVSSADSLQVNHPHDHAGSISDSQMNLDAQSAHEFAATGMEQSQSPVEEESAILQQPRSVEAPLQSPDEQASVVQVNEFMREGGVEVRPASTRDSMAANDSTLPSLEELAGESEAFAETSSSSPHRLSSTPNPVNDWTRYVPEFEPAADSSTQNQPLSQ